MTLHPRFAGISTLALLYAVFSLQAAHPTNDPLWAKAVGVASTNWGWVAGLTVVHSEVLSKGESQGAHEIWTRSTPGTKGEVITETVKVLEDGKDVTAKEKKKDKEKEKSGAKKPGSGGGNPFDPHVQDQISVKPTGRAKAVSGRSCTAYEYELRGKDRQVTKGTAWLEKDTGWPAEIENMTIDPLPDKHLKQLTITTRYESSAEGAWRIKEMITSGVVGILFIKADIRSTATFSEYWKRPAAEEAVPKVAR